MRGFGHKNHHLKIVHISVKTHILYVSTNGHARGHPVCDLHLNLKLKAVAITTANFVVIKEKHRKLPSDKVVGSLHCANGKSVQ